MPLGRRSYLKLPAQEYFITKYTRLTIHPKIWTGHVQSYLTNLPGSSK